MDFFQILVVASPRPYAQTFFFIFEKTIFFDFLGFFFVFVNMGPYWSQNFKTLLLPQINFESFQPVFIFLFFFFLLFSSQWSSQKFCFGFLILTNFWISSLYPLWKPKPQLSRNQNLNYLENEQP